MVIWIPDTFPLNYSYTLLEEARKVPSYILTEGQKYFVATQPAVCGQVREDIRASSI